mmetsp:Transcript_130161/g.296817  ORF Transcript_130161/g.296817 Transcript_130161/m.296817 type:complete len:318 (+) Transcript_130161:11-964(+)
MSHVFVAATIGASCTVVTCSWLLWEVTHLGPVLQSRLFARQLLRLAIADMSLAVALTVRAAVEHSFAGSGGPGLPACWSVAIWAASSRWASVYIEVHIAVGICCSVFRCINAVHYLQWSVTSWPAVGAALAALELWEIPITGASNGTCDYGSQFGYVAVVGSSAAFGCTLVCYLAAMIRTVRRSAHRGARTAVTLTAYALSFWVSYVCDLLLNADWPRFKGGLAEPLSFGLMAANGAFNTVVYFLLTRFGRRLAHRRWAARQTSATNALSFDVFFVPDPLVEEVEDFGSAAIRRAESEMSIRSGSFFPSDSGTILLG